MAWITHLPVTPPHKHRCLLTKRYDARVIHPVSKEKPRMFEALLLVCALSVPDKCVRFDDTRGPYQTYDECKARAYEMADGVVELFPVPASYSFKCIERDFT